MDRDISVAFIPPTSSSDAAATTTTVPLSADQSFPTASPAAISAAASSGSCFKANTAETGTIGISNIPLGLISSIPFALVLLYLPCWATRRWRRVQKKRNAGKEKSEGQKNEDEEEGFVKRKAELQAKSNEKFELEAVESILEIDGECSRMEMAAGEREGRLGKLGRQELMGEECSKEMEVPG